MRFPDIDLNDLDVFEAGVPHEWFRRLRKEAPVYWHDEPDGLGLRPVPLDAEVPALFLFRNGSPSRYQ